MTDTHILTCTYTLVGDQCKKNNSRERAKVLYAVLQRGAESAAQATTAAGGTTGPQSAEHWNALQVRM